MFRHPVFNRVTAGDERKVDLTWILLPFMGEVRALIAALASMSLGADIAVAKKSATEFRSSSLIAAKELRHGPCVACCCFARCLAYHSWS